MSKVYVKPYTPFKITGKDFAALQSDSMRRVVFSPDDAHSISVATLQDTLLLTNESKTKFEFTISRNRRILAVVKTRWQDDHGLLQINTNWKVSHDGVINREIHTNPNLVMSPNFNIDLEGDGIIRLDLKVDNSGFACCSFSEKDLLFVRMNGNHTFPKLLVAAKEEVNANEHQKNEIGRRFFAKWAITHEWGLK